MIAVARAAVGEHWSGRLPGRRGHTSGVRRGGGDVRCCLVAAWLLGLAVFISSTSLASPGNATASVPALDVQLLPPSGPDATVGSITSGALDSRFSPFAGYKATAPAETLWFRLRVPASFSPANRPDPGIPVLIARGGWFEHIDAFATGTGVEQPLPHATELREFGGAHDSVFILPNGVVAGQRRIELPH